MAYDPDLKMWREEEGWLKDFIDIDWKTATDKQVVALGKTLDFKERGLSFPESECLVEALNYWKGKNNRLIKILETGMGWATSTRIFVAWTLKNGGGEINTVEKFYRQLLQETLEKYGYWKHINLLLGQSLEIKWDKPIDFLFIDSGHDYHTCFEEYKKFSKFLTPGGVVGFHDVNLEQVGQALVDINKMDELEVVCKADNPTSTGIRFYKRRVS